MKSAYQKRREEFLVRTRYVNEAYRAAEARQRTTNKHSEDSITRLEIQSTIRNLCSSTKKTRKEILEILDERFSDSKYDNYHQFFETWVSDVLARSGREESER